MNTEPLLEGAEQRIRKHRTSDFELHCTGPDGKPAAGAELEVTLQQHAFRFGANGFLINSIKDGSLQQAYRDRFAGLLNYATLPFYWGGYEPSPDHSEHERLKHMALWCRDNNITAKGHPLVWHEVFPAWAAELDDEEVLERLEARVREIVDRFAGLIDTWDVVNEATVSQRFDNAVGAWIKEHDASRCVLNALEWAHEANPQAELLYNDFNVSEAFEELMQGLVEWEAPVHAVGIQSHMHKNIRPLQVFWDICETYARFKLPLHWTEATILSGRFKAEDDNDWHKRHDDWHTTPEGEAAQCAFGEQFYTLLFSHPAVEAVTWWDFSDHSAWQGAPAGLVRADMSPKPLYERLDTLINKEWTTRTKVKTDSTGMARLSCFFGELGIKAILASGAACSASFSALKKGGRTLKITLG